MLHPGMSPAFGEAKEIGAGCYQRSVTFTMAGDWAASCTAGSSVRNKAANGINSLRIAHCSYDFRQCYYNHRF